MYVPDKNHEKFNEIRSRLYDISAVLEVTSKIKAGRDAILAMEAAKMPREIIEQAKKSIPSESDFAAEIASHVEAAHVALEWLREHIPNTTASVGGFERLTPST